MKKIFKIIHKDPKSKARVGEITTPHGVIKTPSFIPVGTRATVRSLTPEDLKETGSQILFGNTYHLHLKPGEDVVREFGGLGKFMNWDGPTITDSGGFQVFSLGKRRFTQISKQINADISENQSEDLRESPTLVKITNDGVQFRSHIDGSLHMFTPEVSIGIQQKLGADLIVTFDECAPHSSTYEYTKDAMERTHEWAIRSLAASQCHPDPELGEGEGSRDSSGRGLNPQNDKMKQALYGIVQGGVYEDLRIESAKFISKLDFDGLAIGGVSVGESKKQMRDVLGWTVPFLPEEKPRHLLGIGEVDDIFDIIEKGIDTFDCVLPTRFGRYGIIFVNSPKGNSSNKFRMDINKSVYAKDKGPISKDCGCYVCQNFTRAYVHHLFRVQELLAYRLASYHNLYFIQKLVENIRNSILEGSFQRFKKKWLLP